MTSWTGMCIYSSREGVCGSNSMQFRSCHSSSYCTVVEENGSIDTVCSICAVIRFLHTQKQSPAEIHCQLCQVYGPDSMLRRWCRRLTEPKRVVHQGSVLSSSIFNVVMNEIRNKLIGENTTPDMKKLIYYTDDILIGGTSEKLIEKDYQNGMMP